MFATAQLNSFRTRMAALLLAGAAATAFAPADASASFRICNRTSESISVAMAYRSSGDLVTRGWFNAKPGECITPVGGSLQQRYYYVYGTSASGTWGGDNSFCIHEREAFTYWGRPSCAGAGQKSVRFAEVDTGSARDFTYNLTEAVSAQDMHDAIDAVRVTWRASAVENYVMQLRNNTATPVSFRLRCYTRSGYSEWFNVQISSYSVTEIGFLEGWDGNFVSGEWCNAYHGDELVWRADALVTRSGR